MKGIQKLLLIILIIVIPVLITTYAFRFTAFDEKYYFRFYEKYDIYSQFQTKEEVNNNTILLLDYLKGKAPLDTEFFNEKEKLHLVDVKAIMSGLNIASYVSLLAFLFILLHLRRTKHFDYVFKGFLYGGLLTLVLIGIFIIMLATSFHSVFISFHQIFFNNDLWQLDPATDNLIVLFPNAFFYNIAIKIMLSSVITGAIFAGFGLLFKYYRMHRKQRFSHR